MAKNIFYQEIGFDIYCLFFCWWRHGQAHVVRRSTGCYIIWFDIFHTKAGVAMTTIACPLILYSIRAGPRPCWPGIRWNPVNRSDVVGVGSRQIFWCTTESKSNREISLSLFLSLTSIFFNLFFFFSFLTSLLSFFLLESPDLNEACYRSS